MRGYRFNIPPTQQFNMNFEDDNINQDQVNYKLPPKKKDIEKSKDIDKNNITNDNSTSEKMIDDSNYEYNHQVQFYHKNPNEPESISSFYEKDKTPNSTQRPLMQTDNPNEKNKNLSFYYDEDAMSQQVIDEEYLKLQKINCNDEFLSSTNTKFPMTYNLNKDLNYQIGLKIHPMSQYIPSDAIPKVNFVDNSFPRCKNGYCRAYINPFVKFIENGSKWVCNFCKNENVIENYYYSSLDMNGERLDKNTRPELNCGSYEILVDKSYWKNNKPPMIATYLFIIDCSETSIKTGFLNSVLESIKDCINNVYFYNGEITQVGFITYDNNLHFYSMNKKQTQGQMLIPSENFIPTSFSNLIVSIKDFQNILVSTIEQIQNYFINNSNRDNKCVNSEMIFKAIEAGYELLKAYGGKIIVFSGSNNIENLEYMNTKDLKFNTKEEKYYTCTDGKKIANLGLKLTNANISCDTIVSAEKYTNLLTINQICDYSNGNIFFYKNYNVNIHYKNLYNQIKRILTREIAWEACIRTRLSHGYFIMKYQTSVLLTNLDLFVCPTYNSDMNFHVGIRMKSIEEIKTSQTTLKDNFLYMQSSLLYSFGDGTRRVRVHNKVYPITTIHSEIYNLINQEHLAASIFLSTLSTFWKKKNAINTILEFQNSSSTFISSVFSTFISNKKKELPENLYYFPLFILGCFKHRCFCPDEIDKNYDIDFTNYLRLKAAKFSVEDLTNFYYPKFYKIHQLITDKNIGNFNDNGNLNYPDIISANFDYFEENGVYLIDNGYLLILYIRANADNTIIYNLFNVQNIQNINFSVTEELLYDNTNEFKERLVNIIDSIRNVKSIFQNLIFVFENTKEEQIVKDSLIENNFCRWYKYDYQKFYQTFVASNS